MSQSDNTKSEPAGEGTSVRTGKPRGLQFVALVLFIAVLTGTAFLGWSQAGTDWAALLQSIPERIEAMGWWGPAGIIGLMILHCFVPFPAEFVALAAGSVYGTVFGTFLTWSGAMLGAALSFGLTRILGQPFVEWALPKNQKAMLDRWTADQGATTLLVSRFIPVIAFNLINYAAGLTKVNWWTFLWTTGVGILPLTALMVHMGSQMRSLSWEWLLATSVICIAMMALAHWWKRRMSRV
ncbi:MAG: TVP38/TMEM64 family protein [Pseudomonadota bacterium]